MTNTRLALRRFDQLDDRRIDGTAGAYTPFFSPDGQWIGFFSYGDGKLKKMSVNSGVITTICDVFNGNGATWAADDTIIFAPINATGLFRVPAAGGSPQPWTTADRAKRESSSLVAPCDPGAAPGTYAKINWERSRARLTDLVGLHDHGGSSLVDSNPPDLSAPRQDITS